MNPFDADISYMCGHGSSQYWGNTVNVNPLRTLWGSRPKKPLRLRAPLFAPGPDPEGITAHSRSVEDLRDDTTGSLF